MELEISPTPTQPEREAIVAALRELEQEDGFWPEAWWQAGVRENLEADEP